MTTTDVLGFPVQVPARLPGCPGRTWFEALVEGWHDQGRMREHMDGLHQLELSRMTARPPVVELTVHNPATGPLRVTHDPEARTTAFTLPYIPETSSDDTPTLVGIPVTGQDDSPGGTVRLPVTELKR